MRADAVVDASSCKSPTPSHPRPLPASLRYPTTAPHMPALSVRSILPSRIIISSICSSVPCNRLCVSSPVFFTLMTHLTSTSPLTSSTNLIVLSLVAAIHGCQFTGLSLLGFLCRPVRHLLCSRNGVRACYSVCSDLRVLFDYICRCRPVASRSVATEDLAREGLAPLMTTCMLIRVTELHMHIRLPPPPPPGDGHTQVPSYSCPAS